MLARWLVAPAQHVGSTAVSGLGAKPIIDDHRAAHLHLLPVGSLRWGEQLAFRDALRADPALVCRYAELKRALAAAHPTDREAYTAGKADFVRRILHELPNPGQG